MIAVLDRPAAAKQAEKLSVAEMFMLAESYGRVNVFSSDNSPPGEGYHVTIKFEVPAGCSLKAESEFRQPLVTALLQAIERAEEIRSSFR